MRTPQPGEAKGPPRGTATAGSLPLAGAPLEPHLRPAHLCGFPPCESRRGRAPQGFFGVLGVFPPLCLPPAPSTGAPCALQFPPADTWWGSETGHPAAGGGQQHPRDPSEPKGGSVNPGGGLWVEGGPLPQLLGLRRKARLEGLQGVGKGGFNNHKSSQLGGAFTATPTSNPLCYEELKLPGSVLIEGFLTALIGMR